MTVMIGNAQAKSRFDVTAILAIVVMVVFWASSFVVIRVCLGPLTPVELATARYVTAGLIAIGYLAFRSSAPSRRDLAQISIAAVLFIAAYAVLLNTGKQTMPAGPASFIINTMPIFTALIATFAL